MSLGDGVTLADWVRLVASEHGVNERLTDRKIDALLWERTAYPMTTDLATLRPQIVAALVGPDLCPCCGEVLADPYMGVCRPCAERHEWEENPTTEEKQR